MNRKVWLILLLALCILAVPASAVEFDVSRYTMEELMDIQDIVEQRIRELKIQDAAENGDRSISFADSELLLYAGKTQAVSVTVSRRTEDAPKNTTLVWSSDHPEVATAANGKIRAVSAGEAVITAAAKDNEFISASVHVRVLNSVSSVTLDQKEITLLIGGNDKSLSEWRLSADILPADAPNRNLLWSSSNNSVVTVDKKGGLTAQRAGTATVTVQTDDPSLSQQKTAKCKVTVLQAVTKIILSRNSVVLNIGKTEKLTAKTMPKTATRKGVVWSSSDETVATVSSGVVKALNPGSCTIFCTAEDGSGEQDTCKITVYRQITGILPEDKDSAVRFAVIGSTVTLSPRIEPQDATRQELAWALDNSMAAELTGSTGISIQVNAKNPGTVFIMASAMDGSQQHFTYTLRVERAFAVEKGKSDWGIDNGEKWFREEVQNISNYRTVESVTIRYYGIDTDGNRITADGQDFTDITVPVLIAPGKTASTPVITVAGLPEAKAIYSAIVRVQYSDGTAAETDRPNYRFKQY